MKVTLDELKSEISKFISNGGKLGRVYIHNSDDNSYCALGACYRNLFGTFEDRNKSEVYETMFQRYNLGICFCNGFDRATSDNSWDIEEEIDDAKLGFSLGLWCKEKGYI